MKKKGKEEIEKLKDDCVALEEQVKLLVKTELKLRRTQAELIQSKGKIEEYNKTLEQKVEERTKDLEKLNAELIEFTYIASHDLQAPLYKINIFGEWLKEKYDSIFDDQGREYLEGIQDSVIRMRTLIKDLLAYSKVTTHAKPYSTVNLSQIIEEVLSDLGASIEKVSAKVEIEHLPVIEADPTQMRQLFQNLIDNAIKFHKPDKPPIVKIYVLKKLQDKPYSIVIEDNGIGIDKKNHDKIFGVFQRLYGNDEYEGSGIGLAVCKKIIERHGGTIQVESKLGEGTKFIIHLNK